MTCPIACFDDDEELGEPLGFELGEPLDVEEPDHRFEEEGEIY